MSEECIIIDSDEETIAQPSPPASVSSSTDPPRTSRTSQSVLECYTQNTGPSESRDFDGVLLQQEFARLGIPIPNFGLYNGPSLRQLLDALVNKNEESIQKKQNVQNVEETQSDGNPAPREPIPKLKIKITPKRQTKAKEAKGSKRYKLNEYSLSKTPTTSKRKYTKKSKVPVNNTPAHYISQKPFVDNNPPRHIPNAGQEVLILNTPVASQREQMVANPGTSHALNIPANIIPSKGKVANSRTRRALNIPANIIPSEVADPGISRALNIPANIILSDKVADIQHESSQLVSLVDLIRNVSDTNELIKNELLSLSLPQNSSGMRHEHSCNPPNPANGSGAQTKSFIRITNELAAQAQNLRNMSKECSTEIAGNVHNLLDLQPQNPSRNHTAQPLNLRVAPQNQRMPSTSENFIHIERPKIHRQYERTSRDKGIQIVECHTQPISAHGGQSVHTLRIEKPELKTQIQPGQKKQTNKLIQQSKLQLFESQEVVPQARPQQVQQMSPQPLGLQLSNPQSVQLPNLSPLQEQEDVPQANDQQVQQMNPQHAVQQSSSQQPLLIQQFADQVKLQNAQPVAPQAIRQQGPRLALQGLPSHQSVQQLQPLVQQHPQQVKQQHAEQELQNAQPLQKQELVVQSRHQQSPQLALQGRQMSSHQPVQKLQQLQQPAQQLKQQHALAQNPMQETVPQTRQLQNQQLIHQSAEQVQLQNAQPLQQQELVLQARHQQSPQLALQGRQTSSHQPVQKLQPLQQPAQQVKQQHALPPNPMQEIAPQARQLQNQQLIHQSAEQVQLQNVQQLQQQELVLQARHQQSPQLALQGRQMLSHQPVQKLQPFQQPAQQGKQQHALPPYPLQEIVPQQLQNQQLVQQPAQQIKQHALPPNPLEEMVPQIMQLQVQQLSPPLLVQQPSLQMEQQLPPPSPQQEVQMTPQAMQLQVQHLGPQLPLLVQQSTPQAEQLVPQPVLPGVLLFQQSLQSQEQPTTQSSESREQTNALQIQLITNQESSHPVGSSANQLVQYQPQYPIQECIQLPDGRIFMNQLITPNGELEQGQNNQALVAINRPLRLQTYFPFLFYPNIENPEIGFFMNRFNERQQRYLPITEPVSPVEEKKQIENSSGQERQLSLQNVQPISVIEGNRSYHDSFRSWVSNNSRNSQSFDTRNRRAELRHINISQTRNINSRNFHQFYQQRFPNSMGPPFFPFGTFPFRTPSFQGSRFQQRFSNRQNFGFYENFQQNRWNRGPN